MVLNYDAVFLCKKPVSGYGDTVAYSDHVVGCPQANSEFNRPAFVAWIIGAATSGQLTVTLQTSDEPSFSSGVVDLAAYPVPPGSLGRVISARLPDGAKRYLRLKLQASGSVTGGAKITAALITDPSMMADL